VLRTSAAAGDASPSPLLRRPAENIVLVLYKSSLVNPLYHMLFQEKTTKMGPIVIYYYM